MLLSQRTRLLQRGQTLMVLFDPAEILPADAGAVITCVVGSFRRLGKALNVGGFLPDYQLAFRVTRALFPTAAVGNLLQWRIPGETTYRATVRIDQIIDRPSVPHIVLGCVNREK